LRRSRFRVQFRVQLDRSGYPTQKPERLLERIITSSRPENGKCGLTEISSIRFLIHYAATQPLSMGRVRCFINLAAYAANAQLRTQLYGDFQIGVFQLTSKSTV